MIPDCFVSPVIQSHRSPFILPDSIHPNTNSDGPVHGRSDCQVSMVRYSLHVGHVCNFTNYYNWIDTDWISLCYCFPLNRSHIISIYWNYKFYSVEMAEHSTSVPKNLEVAPAPASEFRALR